MEHYVASFCERYEYPPDAIDALGDAYGRISRTASASAIFENLLDEYICDGGLFDALDKAAELSGAHRYTVHLLYHICLSKHTKRLYAERQIPENIFYDSMADLKYKLFECRRVYGIWGTFVGEWFKGFFDLTRFTLGRLQYEPIKFSCEYNKNGHVLHPGDTVLNIHIPSSGPLRREDCAASYRQAAEFFRESFPGKPVAFVCDSWLLFPKHREFLPQTSNILAFMDDFDIISERTDGKFSDLWRIFDQQYDGSPASLPRDTSLRRAYAEWIEQGNSVGSGYGVFFLGRVETI